MSRLAKWSASLGVALLGVGWYMGLFVAPPERHMGEVQRIMYMHVPTAWVALVALSVAFVVAICSLWSGNRKWDDRLVGYIEVGVVLGALLLIQGSIWGRATWGVWWDWDVRLTTSLVLVLLFAGILALRRLVEGEDQRATWSAIATIVAYVDVPLVYFCVRWWRSLHQVQSTPDTVAPGMVVPLRISAFGMLFLAIALAAVRTTIESRRRAAGFTPLPERLPSEGATSHA